MSNAANTVRKIPTAQQTAVCVKINAIRAKFGNDGSKCCTCGRNAADPYRSVDSRGYTIEGCVDSSHHGKLIGEAQRWFSRPQAHALRKQELERIAR